LSALPLTTPLPAGSSIRARLPTFRAEAAGRAHVASMPGTTWPVGGLPPGSSRAGQDLPGSDATWS